MNGNRLRHPPSSDLSKELTNVVNVVRDSEQTRIHTTLLRKPLWLKGFLPTTSLDCTDAVWIVLYTKAQDMINHRIGYKEGFCRFLFLMFRLCQHSREDDIGLPTVVPLLRCCGSVMWSSSISISSEDDYGRGDLVPKCHKNPLSIPVHPSWKWIHGRCFQTRLLWQCPNPRTLLRTSGDLCRNCHSWGWEMGQGRKTQCGRVAWGQRLRITHLVFPYPLASKWMPCDPEHCCAPPPQPIHASAL